MLDRDRVGRRRKNVLHPSEVQDVAGLVTDELSQVEAHRSACTVRLRVTLNVGNSKALLGRCASSWLPRSLGSASRSGKCAGQSRFSRLGS
jgi:hypothetical protein